MSRAGGRSRQALARLLAALLVGCCWLGADGAAASPFDIEIANLRLLEGNGWQTGSRFAVAWNLAPGDGTAPAAEIRYLLQRPEGTEVARGSLPADLFATYMQIPAGPHGEEPAPGAYRLSFWLQGANGLQGPAKPLTLRLDNEPPPPVRPLVPSGWIGTGATVELRIEHPSPPPPLSGIRGYAVALDSGSGAKPCAGAICKQGEIDLDGGEDDDSIVLGRLAEGTSLVRVVAVSGSGLHSAVTGTARIRVDGTPPSIVIGGAPDGWSNRALAVTATASDELSGMAATGPGGPLTAIAVDGGAPSVAQGGRAEAVVHGDGAHHLTAFARDAVGNLGLAGPDGAGRTIWIDETSPRVAFAGPDPAAPERIVAVVDDALSGPSRRRGSISIRPAGTGLAFEPLPTRVAGDRLIADWPSDAYPRGGYEFRAVGFDVAGNRAETTRRADGTAMRLSNPVKTPTALAFGFGGRRFVAHRCRRGRSGLRCHRHAIAAFSRRPAVTRAAYRRRMPVSGRLTGAAGAPLAGMPVAIVETFAAGSRPASRTTSAITGEDGFFRARLDPGPSRRIAVAFAGTDLLTAVRGRELGLDVRSAVHLRASGASARVGGAPVVFRGRLGHRGATLPAEGVRVAFEFRVGGLPWTEFRTVQTKPSGAFRLAYAFSDDDSRGVRFQFRARVARQPGWPYGPAHSLPVTVTGR